MKQPGREGRMEKEVWRERGGRKKGEKQPLLEPRTQRQVGRCFLRRVCCGDGMGAELDPHTHHLPGPSGPRWGIVIIV